jgi:hypothetical protein
MKKSLLTIILAASCSAIFAQEAKNEFDQKWRFGLRVTPQPTWFTSNDKNNIPAGAKFGIGFGLNVEYRFSEVAGFLTGIGGDFEGGTYKFKYDPANNYEAQYWMDADELIKPGKQTSSSTKYFVQERKVSTTHVTIPLILKLSTQEYSGMKYFGMFGAEIGIRAKAKATDTYVKVVKSNYFGGDSLINTDLKVSDINIGPETGVVPLRLGLNAGLGGEYRLGGSTSLFISANYFYSFTNLMRKQSDYTFYRVEGGTHRYIKQGLKMNAIRINIGILF